MTREEAIYELIELQDGSVGAYDAVRMAIKALQAQNRPIICPRCGREFAESEGKEYNSISIENQPYTEEYAKGYNDAKREIALSGEYERAYWRGRADAVEVVRCAECKHYDYHHPEMEQCLMWHNAKIRPTKDFCSRGERREK